MKEKMTKQIKFVHHVVLSAAVRNQGVKKLKLLVNLVVSITVALVTTSHAAAATYYFHNDHLGTPQLVTDENQQVVWKGEYDPFGKVTETVSDIEQNLRFPGQYFDQETGLHYNYFRTYDPNTGRYVESDPIGLAGGLSTYGYAYQNPIIYTDPKGQNAVVTWGLRIGGGAICLAPLPGARIIGIGAIAATIPGSTVYSCGETGSCSSDETDDKEREDRCDKQYYDVDIPTCRGISRSRGKAAAKRCYASAAERYAACLAGLPIPPLDTYNN